MRLLLGLFFLSAVAALSRAADAQFVRVWPGWREAESFDRIGEYLGQGEQTGRQVVIRSHPESRAGYYFLTRIKHSADLTGAKFILQVIRPDKPDTLTFSFPVPPVSGSETVFDLGLTGPDWPAAKKAHPVAWRLQLVSASGTPLGEQKSFLWEK
jgi:hypothetical protein